MGDERVSITIEFKRPGGGGRCATSIEECIGLVMNQMRAKPIWEDPSGTGHLNYVCLDTTMEVTEAKIIKP